VRDGYSSGARDGDVTPFGSLGLFHNLGAPARAGRHPPLAANGDLSRFLSSNDFAVLSDASAPPPMVHLAAVASGMGIDLNSEPAMPPPHATRGRSNSDSLPSKRTKRGGQGSCSSTVSAGGAMADRLPGPMSEASPGRRQVCSLWLQSEDEMQCRFAVKNDDKASNQELQFVQANGYVEYKARYCKKRGQQSGYGYFHIAFLPYER
jgi:hypothetical protein